MNVFVAAFDGVMLSQEEGNSDTLNLANGRNDIDEFNVSLRVESQRTSLKHVRLVALVRQQ